MDSLSGASVLTVLYNMLMEAGPDWLVSSIIPLILDDLLVKLLELEPSTCMAVFVIAPVCSQGIVQARLKRPLLSSGEAEVVLECCTLHGEVTEDQSQHQQV